MLLFKVLINEGGETISFTAFSTAVQEVFCFELLVSHIRNSNNVSDEVFYLGFDVAKMCVIRDRYNFERGDVER